MGVRVSWDWVGMVGRAGRGVCELGEEVGEHW